MKQKENKSEEGRKKKDGGKLRKWQKNENWVINTKNKEKKTSKWMKEKSRNRNKKNMIE